MCMNYIISHTWNGEVPDNANAEENQVTGIRWAEKGITGALNLADVQLEHLLLHFPDNAAEYICDGQPKKDIDISGNPLGKGML